MEQVQQEINRKCKLHGHDHHIWFGKDYDLTSSELHDCRYVVVDVHAYQWHEDHAIIFIKLADIVRQLRVPEFKDWVSARKVGTYKFIPCADGKHDFSAATYGFVFNNMEDAVMYRLTWGDL